MREIIGGLQRPWALVVAAVVGIGFWAVMDLLLPFKKKNTTKNNHLELAEWSNTWTETKILCALHSPARSSFPFSLKLQGGRAVPLKYILGYC